MSETETAAVNENDNSWLPAVCAMYGFLQCYMVEPHVAYIDILPDDDVDVEQWLSDMIRNRKFEKKMIVDVSKVLMDADEDIPDSIWGPFFNLAGEHGNQR